MSRVALIQHPPVLFDREASLQKVALLAEEAQAQAPDLILFPEAFLPGYPRGLHFGTVIGDRAPYGRDLWAHYYQQCLQVPGPATDFLGQVARKAQAYLAIGVVEQAPNGGTLYCSLLYFDPEGRLIGRHRKLKPTGTERLIWGEGDGRSLYVHPTPLGRIGGLICWENYMPLARMALYQQGIEIYLAPTADSRDGWQATLRHIALEGRCFVLGCNQYVQRSDYPDHAEVQDEIAGQPDIMCRGGSVIVGPLGEVLAGPLWDTPGILYADLDPEALVRARMDFDVAGHYARPDILRLIHPDPHPGI